VYAGPLPASIYPLVSRVCGNQQLLAEAIAQRDLNKAFLAFVNDPLVRLPLDQARELFCRMLDNTSKYLNTYDLKTMER
jgi:alpha-galactosidase